MEQVGEGGVCGKPPAFHLVKGFHDSKLLFGSGDLQIMPRGETRIKPFTPLHGAVFRPTTRVRPRSCPRPARLSPRGRGSRCRALTLFPLSSGLVLGPCP